MSSKQAMAQEEVTIPDLPPPPSYQAAHEQIHRQYTGSSGTIPQVPHPTHSFTPGPATIPSPQLYPSPPTSTSYAPMPVHHHYAIAETPSQQQQRQGYYSQNSDDKLEFNSASEFYPPGPANQIKRQSSANAYPPMANPEMTRRDSQYSTYKPQVVYGDSMNRMSTIPEQMMQMPPMSPTITTYEPRASMPMVADVKNVLEKPKYPNGEREWSYGMCGCCCEHFGTCCFACLCPCVVYAKIKSRVSFLERNNYPHPAGGSGCTSECFIHGCLTSLFGIGWVLQIGQRSTIRDRYRISGNGCGDCMAVWCCNPCTLTQESREVALEERALGGNEKSLRLD